jgi:capsular polysaccharide biosynthesis protein
MAVRKLSSRHVRFQLGRTLARAIPGLRGRMPFYDTVKPMIEAGRAQIVSECQNVNLGPQDAAFAAKLPDAPPERIERSIALIALDNATVLGSTGVVVDETREELLTPRGARDYATYHDFRPVLSSVVQKPDAAYFNMLGSHQGHRHYFHFLFDRLPRLYYLLNRFELGREPVTVLTNADLPAFQRDIYRFIQQRFPNVRFEAVPPNERWRMRRLFHIDDYQPIKRTLADPALLDFIRTLVFDGFDMRRAPSGHRRIYVSRGDTPRRRIANEREILPILSKHGFEIIAPGTLGFRDQVALFSSAEVVAGAHGAGLTNILFAPESAKVLEIFPVSRLKNTYFLLSLSLGQTYRAVIGDAGDRKEWFTVDPRMVEDTLDALLSSSRQSLPAPA